MLFLIPHSAFPYCTGDQLLLPTPAQGLIEMNQSEQFIASRLSKVQLGGEQIAIGVQALSCVSTPP